MSTASRLLREDLRDFAGYASARSHAVQGEVWLNANESALPSVADPDGTLRRYPDPQPQALRSALARLYRVPTEALLVTRGSDEGIDLLLRAFCPPGRGAIVIAPPVFGMYAVCARLHGARVVEVPALDTGEAWRSDLGAMANAAEASGAGLVFVCNPGNPTGEAVPADAIEELAARLAGRALVVVDGAYAEFADEVLDPALLDAHDNLVLLRTLSKAHALAAARIGSVLASPEVVRLLQRCQAPYPLAQPAVAAALAALAPSSLAQVADGVAQVRAERARLQAALACLPGVRAVYPSQGNFVLARFDDAQAAYEALLAAGVVVRDMRATPALGDALRISIGTPAQDDRVLAALSAMRRAA
ncbi:histidinol-phosphate transaminase [Thermomonas mangrovi]|uniref:histidinol-phosphate transaminase n=1 Tax=Thermomonas mangrovi TaxID=2993316 RepID=UPI002307A96F|nr:histidinol-phosphate transaminase [Thermomonas mangrovi]